MNDEAPGWDAIDAALAGIYGDTEPSHYAPRAPMVLGGNDPLQGISAYRSAFGGHAHWHFVTYGYSDLYDKETDDPEFSGFGFEMTLRVVDPEHVDSPPSWAVSVLQNLARYVFRTGKVFQPNHHLTLNGPIVLGRQTQLVAAGFVPDPELRAMETPNGRVEFVQLVGLTGDEYDAIRAWDAAKLFSLIGSKDPAWLTDVARSSWLSDPALAEQVREGMERDGSSMGVLHCMKGSWTRERGHDVLGIAANALEDVQLLLRGRLVRGKHVILAWPEGGVVLVAAGAPSPIEAGRLPLVTLTPADIQAFLGIPVQRGDYPLPSGRTSVRIIPIEIRSGMDNRVERVIG